MNRREALPAITGILVAAVAGLLAPSRSIAFFLGGLIALVLLAVFIHQPKWGALSIVALFGLGTYSNFGGTLSIFGLASLGATGAWLVNAALAHRIELPRSRVALFAVLYLLVCVVSMAWASDVRQGIVWLIPLAQVTILALLIGTLFRSRRDIHQLIGVFVVSIAGGVGWGTFQEYLFRTGGWQVYYATNTRGTGALTIGNSARIAGTFFNPASMATYALIALVFATYFSSSARGAKSILPWLAVSGLFAWGVLATLSRGPIMVLVLLIPVFGWFFRDRLKIFIAVGLLLVPVILQFAPSDLVTRLSTVTDFGSKQVSNGERLFILQSGIRLIAAHPLFGVGYGNFPVRIAEYMGVYQANFSARDAHNELLEVTGETGLVGLAIFAAMIAATYLALLRIARAPYAEDDRFIPKLAWTCVVAMTCLLAVGMTTPLRPDRCLYFILGVTLAAEAMCSTRAVPAPAIGPGWQTAERSRLRPAMPATAARA